MSKCWDAYLEVFEALHNYSHKHKPIQIRDEIKIIITFL